MENQNEISSLEDDSPLVEDIILQSKNPNKGFLALKTDFESKNDTNIYFFQKHLSKD